MTMQARQQEGEVREMIVATGTKISDGIAIGRIRILKEHKYEISYSRTEDREKELERLEHARSEVQKRQHILYEKAMKSAGEDGAAIFEAHELMLEDEELIDPCKELIMQRSYKAEYAIWSGFDKAAQMFREMENPYLRERSTDIGELKNALLDVLSGWEMEEEMRDEPYILAAEDLTPSETVRLDQKILLGIVTREGSSNSHMAILAKSMDLPALIRCKEIDKSWEGKLAILDGEHSSIYIDPDPEFLEKMTAKRDERKKQEALLSLLKGKENKTLDGKTIKVCANIGDPSEIEDVLENDADGVGLFRSELLYLNSETEPSEEEQFQAYKRVAQALAPKQVIIRTCDIGADKSVSYMRIKPEDNPALGCRGIRLCLTRNDFFKRQLRAILRASAYGNLGIMFPMIVSVKEVRECNELLAECRRELTEEGVETGQMQTGIMIETPAAALCADELAEEVDFFSIGTNDLTQYTCAIDRQNANLERFLDPYHPALFKLIQMTVEAGHRHQIEVGICGELGADPMLTEMFLKMGVDELSVNPRSILPLRKKIRSIDVTKQDENE